MYEDYQYQAWLRSKGMESKWKSSLQDRHLFFLLVQKEGN